MGFILPQHVRTVREQNNQRCMKHSIGFVRLFCYVCLGCLVSYQWHIAVCLLSITWHIWKKKKSITRNCTVKFSLKTKNPIKLLYVNPNYTDWSLKFHNYLGFWSLFRKKKKLKTQHIRLLNFNGNCLQTDAYLYIQQEQHNKFIIRWWI